GKSRRNYRRRGCPWGSRDAESGWRLSTQNGDGVLVLCSLYLHIDGLRTSSFKLGFGLCYIYRGSHASVIAISRKIERFIERSDSRVQHLRFGIERAELEVINCKIGVKRQIHGFEICCAGLRV